MKKQINIGWVSDSHLGYSQYSSHLRRRDMVFGLHNAVTGMLACKVDAIIHTGDLFNSSRPSAEDIRALQELHNLLISHNTFCYCITGNHDWVGNPAWLDVLVPDARGGCVRIDDAPRVSVGGINIRGYASMSRTALMSRFETDDLENIHILMLHQPVQDFIGFPAANALSMADIPNKFPVVALGDIHIHDLRTKLTDDGRQCVYGYPGSTELCSASEDPIKKWAELKFEDGKIKQWVAHEFPTRPVRQYEITDEATLGAALLTMEILAGEVKAKTIDTPLVFVAFPTTMPEVMDRVRQALAGIDALIIPQPKYVPVKPLVQDIATSKVGPEMTVVDLLQLQMKPSETLYDIIMQLLNPDIDSKQALSAFIEKRLQPKVENE